MSTVGHPLRQPAGVALTALAGAFLAGIVLARWLDWMGHGHPKQ